MCILRLSISGLPVLGRMSNTVETPKFTDSTVTNLGVLHFCSRGVLLLARYTCA